MASNMLNGISSNTNNAASSSTAHPLPYEDAFPPLDMPLVSNENGTSTSAGQSKRNKKKSKPVPTQLPPKLHPSNAARNGMSDGTKVNGFNSPSSGGFGSHTSKGTRPASSTASTSILHIAYEERRFPMADAPSTSPTNVLGGGSNVAIAQASQQQRKVCQTIASRTDVKIDYNINKDLSMSVNIIGRSDAIQEAKKLLSRELIQQMEETIQIPQTYHRFVLGKRGCNIQEIEQRTGVKITMPDMNQRCDEIVLTGCRESLATAKQDIYNIYTEQAKRAQETVSIPKDYHPLLCGPGHRWIDELRNRTLAKVNIPPFNVPSSEIIVTGEKDGVLIAVKELQHRAHLIAQDYVSLRFVVEKQLHRYVCGVRGVGVNEIFEETGVYVEIPSIDSNEDALLLKGPSGNLGAAISMVVERSRSMQMKTLQAPQWLRRYLIGSGGSRLKELTAGKEKLRIDFVDNQDVINMEGPHDEVEEVSAILQNEINSLLARLAAIEIPAKQEFHKHIIGRNGTNAERLQRDFNVEIKVLPTAIRIEGPRENIEPARKDIQEMLAKMENEKQKDIIIDQRFHRQIIGTQGRSIRDLRSKYPNVQINFPDAKLESDIVQLRGPRQEVDAAAQEIMVLYKELANVVELTVQIPSNIHASLIGTKGHVLRNIKSECGGGVQIKFPQKDDIDSGKLKKDEVFIRGPKEEAERAKKLLNQLSKEKEALSFEDKVKCRPDMHRFLIGRRGENLAKIREASGGARVVLPSLDLSTGLPTSDEISIVGSKESVAKAKQMLEEKIAEWENIVEKECRIAPKWHKHFIQKRFQVLNSISSEFGGVNISFPKLATAPGQETSSIVKVKGPAQCVDGAIQRLMETVDDLEAQVSIQVTIPQQYHRSLIGTSGSQVRNIQELHGVNIKFPAGNQNGNSPQRSLELPTTFGPEGSGIENASLAAAVNSSDLVIINGREENCEAAKQALLDLIPIESKVSLESEYHGLLIGQKGAGIQQVSKDCQVQIQMPDAKENCEHIVVKGTSSAIRQFEETLQGLKVKWDEQKAERIAKSFQKKLEIPTRFHKQIIGVRGTKITELSNQHQVIIQMPQQSRTNSNRRSRENGANDEASDEDTEETVTVIGYQDKVEAACEAIMQRVHVLEEMMTEELNLPCEIHNRIIGPRGRNLRQLVEQFGVEEIVFPPSNGPQSEGVDKDLVLVTGLPDKLDSCCDHLIQLANDFMEQYEERQMMRAIKSPPTKADAFHHRSHTEKGKNSGFSVSGAPWQRQDSGRNGDALEAVPNHSDAAEFPLIGNNGLDKKT